LGQVGQVKTACPGDLSRLNALRHKGLRGLWDSGTGKMEIPLAVTEESPNHALFTFKPASGP